MHNLRRQVSTAEGAWILVFTIGLVVLATIFRGYVAMQLWGWSVAPALGAPALALRYAIGIGVLCGMWAGRQPTQQQVTEEIDPWAPVRNVFAGILYTSVPVLLIGYLVHVL
ncbi:hypothetical protein [Aggregatilinea lenta]|uniref:hypothetical protein n=1 Tax=Aggregatilinea lenta TaxID=913108 RepID=UPI000E5B40CA|nr:hypothetical protein [Aggregatilinea lenta]